jgi:hypothetical protein
MVQGAKAYKIYIYFTKDGSSKYFTTEAIRANIPSGFVTKEGTIQWRVGACPDSACSDDTKIAWSSYYDLKIAKYVPSEGSGSGETSGGETSTGGKTGGSYFGSLTNPLKYDTVEEIVEAISVFLLNIGIVLSPVMLIIAGLMYITAGGNSDKIRTAQKMMLWTLVGLAFILLARGLVAVLQSVLGVEEQSFLLFYPIGFVNFLKNIKGRYNSKR